VQFPTGGKTPEPEGMIRVDSGGGRIVWMEEDDGTIIFVIMM